jgi:hypothetical protein
MASQHRIRILPIVVMISNDPFMGVRDNPAPMPTMMDVTALVTTMLTTKDGHTADARRDLEKEVTKLNFDGDERGDGVFVWIRPYPRGRAPLGWALSPSATRYLDAELDYNIEILHNSLSERPKNCGSQSLKLEIPQDVKLLPCYAVRGAAHDAQKAIRFLLGRE